VVALPNLKPDNGPASSAASKNTMLHKKMKSAKTHHYKRVQSRKRNKEEDLSSRLQVYSLFLCRQNDRYDPYWFRCLGYLRIESGSCGLTQRISEEERDLTLV
jgi:hypothetical protein